MQKNVLKIIIVIAIITVISWLTYVCPSFSTNEEVRNNTYNEANDVEEDEDSNTENNNDVGSIQSNNNVKKPVQTGTTQTSGKQISSYSTVSPLPEANLGLNNILNVILIAIGIIIILLAIAILIRLNK